MGSVDIEAEKKVIISLIKRTFDAEERKDIETKMQYYDEDFVWLGENRPIVKDLDLIKQGTLDSFKLDMKRIIDWDYLDVSLSGDMAYGYGNAETTMQGPEGEVKSYSKGLSVFKKRDGVWRCVAASTTSNSPQE
jgi:ketosteroid isomerase-like protein